MALRKQKIGVNNPNPTAALDVTGDAKVSGALTAGSISGSYAPSGLSSAVPISKGGTGATTAANARTNLAVLPLAGGTVTGQVKSTYANSGGFLVEHGTANKEACYEAKRTDTDVSLYVGIGSGGTNHGVYSRTLGKWMIYGDSANVHVNGTSENVSGTVAVGHGGTGATSAASARTNLGIACTSLYSGTLTGTNSCTFNYLAAIRKIMDQGDNVVDTVRQGLSQTMENRNKERIDALSDEIVTIQEAALNLLKEKQRLEITEAEYNERKQKYQTRMNEIEAERASAQDEATKYYEIKQWLKTFEDTLGSGEILTADDGSIMRTLVENIIVKRDGIEINFKCGCSVEQEYVK